MRYSTSAMVLAAASTFTSVLAVPSQHAHAHHHNKKAVLEDRDIVIVYETKTVMWEEPAKTSAYVAPTPTTPAYVAPAPTTTPAAAVFVAAPTSAKAAATTSVSQSHSGSSNIIESTVNILESAVSKLLGLGVCQVGVNAVSSNGAAWIGSDGAYTMDFVNKASETLTVVVWGSWGSWVNVKQPTITISLDPGNSKTVSFANGFSGAFSAIYSDTSLVNGQISNTWGECTFTEQGVCDVSREVNMSGHNLSIVGPDCTSDMSTCVFVCDSGNVCTTGYSLKNCAAGSQVGAQSGVDTWGNGGASGGCGWSGKSSAKLTATWS